MSSTKKDKPVFEDPVNTKIQRQFNLVFNGDEKSKSPNEKANDENDNSLSFDAQSDEDMTIERGGSKKNIEAVATTISLDLASDSDAPPIPSDEAGTVIAKNTGLDFNLDFDLEAAGESTIIAPKSASSLGNANETTNSIKEEEALDGFVLDELDLAMNLSESTQKTVILNFDKLKAGATGFTIEKTDSSINLVSNDEEKANIESTIKDILRPTSESLKSANLSEAQSTLSLANLNNELNLDSNEDKTTVGNLQDSGLNFGGAASEEFTLNEPGAMEEFSLEGNNPLNSKNTSNDTNFFEVNAADQDTENEDFSMLSDAIETPKAVTVSSTAKVDFSEEDLLSFGDEYADTPDDSDPFTSLSSNVSAKNAQEDFTTSSDSFSQSVDDAMDSLFEDPTHSKSASLNRVEKSQTQGSPPVISSGSMNTEDSIRVQATIRSLREEREELLAKIKMFKTESKELEQDNLTLKANLDEAKIEITILRKRHMVELEDIKYRLTMSEEKKALAEEKARQAELRKEKLEQKVRIDFNQVKQREKELESKLELLSMDVDSQVQSRDHKILELRRKIDALEFNMENASIKEHRSNEDKRKLEDRLNKIMKTLRHSIKNLEDDIDHQALDSDHQKDKN
jgi:hypothetical protein